MEHRRQRRRGRELRRLTQCRSSDGWRGQGFVCAEAGRNRVEVASLREEEVEEDEGDLEGDSDGEGEEENKKTDGREEDSESGMAGGG